MWPVGAVGRHAIGAGQHRRGKVGHGRGVRAHIGAVVVEELILDAEDAAFCVDGRAHLVRLLARMIGGDQVLAPVLDPLDRRFELQRGGANQHVLRIKFAADAEAAADMALVKLHGVPRPAEHLRQRDRDSSAAPWRRRTFPGCRALRRSGRWRRAFPAARRSGGRRKARAKQRRARRGRRRRRRHSPLRTISGSVLSARRS